VERSWTLEAVRTLLPDVRARTERAVREAEALAAEHERLAPGPDRHAAQQRTEDVIRRWAREMEALGAEAKGLWLVDFDTGGGYYCWRWPEPGLHFHGYEDGFAGRVPIH